MCDSAAFLIDHHARTHDSTTLFIVLEAQMRDSAAMLIHCHTDMHDSAAFFIAWEANMCDGVHHF